MTLRLILMRHAKSNWDSPTLDDHARPLNARGRRSASALGAWLADHGCHPDLVLSSDAARTRETWRLAEPNLPAAPEVIWLDQLYLAPAATMLVTLRNIAMGQTVLMLGHNPGIGGFAQSITTAPHPHPKFVQYPTAATAVIDLNAEAWREVDWRSGHCVDFIVPRDLGVT